MIEPSHLVASEELVVKLLRGTPAELTSGSRVLPAGGGTPSYRLMGVAPLVPPFRVEPTKRYLLKEFLRFDDQAFVAAAYVGLLQRYPDVEGGEHYLRRIREGVSKTEILGSLRYSAEGKRVGADVAGLRRRYLAQLAMRIPLLGRLIAISVALIRLPELLAMVRRLECAGYRHAQTAVERVAELDRHIARQSGTPSLER